MTIQQHGGQFIPPDNLLNPDRLEYVLEVVSSNIFGEELYPTVESKAAVYLHAIISGHVFQDGNKRTGYESALLLLKLNGRQIEDSLPIIPSIEIPTGVVKSQCGLYSFVTAVASSQLELDEISAWFARHVIKY